MNEQRFTVHINFIKNERFVEEKNEQCISALYLDFWYAQNYYNPFITSDLLLATLYASSTSSMEDFKFIVCKSPSLHHSINVLYNDLLISE